jgi:hypothetical protein
VTYGVKVVPSAPTTTATVTTTSVMPIPTTTIAVTTTSATPAPTISTTTTPVTTTLVVVPHPASFAASNLVINPSTVKPGENVNIYVRITNTGDVTGTDTVVLKIDNLVIASKDVTLAGGVSTVVIFTTSSKLAENYVVEVAGLNGNFTVSESGMPNWFWVSVIGALVLGIILVVGFALLRKRGI